MNTPNFIYEIGQSEKLNSLSDFENKTPTHNYKRNPRIFINFAKFTKSNSQGIKPKSSYLQNRHNSLDNFKFFEIKKRSQKKIMAISNFESQPKHTLNSNGNCLIQATVHELRRMSVNPASPMKNINVKRVGTRGLGSISRKDNRSDISLNEIDDKKRHHRKVLSLKIHNLI